MRNRFSISTIFKAIDQVTAPVRRMQASVVRFTSRAAAGLGRVNSLANAVGASLRRGAVRGVKLFTAGAAAAGAAVLAFVNQFSKVENAEAAFTPLLGGAEQARKAVEALNQTAASTPFAFQDIASSAEQLLPVMNGDIERMVSTFRMLGDTAGGNAQKLDSITRGYTKALLKTKVDMESLNMIAEAGVPIFSELADVLGVEMSAGFFKLVSAGKVSTDQLTEAFRRMTSEGGKFYQGMEIASRTTTGLWSTFVDNLKLAAATIGSALAPVIKDLIRDATVIAQKVRAWAEANREVIAARFLEYVTIARQKLTLLIDKLQGLNQEYSLLDRAAALFVRLSDAAAWVKQHGSDIAKTAAYVAAFIVVLKTLVGVLTLVNLVMAANPVTLITLGIIAATAAIAAFVVKSRDIVAWFESAPTWVRMALGPFEALARIITYIRDNWEAITRMDLGALWGSEDDEPAGPMVSTRRGRRPAVVTEGEAIVNRLESHTSESATVTIQDATGRASVTRGRMGRRIKLEQTGGF